PELAFLDGKYYLHGRSGHKGEGTNRFVLYQSDDGIKWKNGLIISSEVVYLLFCKNRAAVRRSVAKPDCRW
ncbi:MAG TPA: hypothetical protein QF564_18645, partial [Pirellulaceae bacterium]|nr:hypothetical protein [Pirellulaceae bacterium]